MGNACLSLAQGRPDKIAYLDSGAAWFQKMVDGSKADDYYYPLALEGLAKAKAAKGDREGAWQAAPRPGQGAGRGTESAAAAGRAAQARRGPRRGKEPDGPADETISAVAGSRYLRKMNSGVDTSRWKSGSGLPRPALPPAQDTLPMAPKVQDAGPMPSEVRPVPVPAGPGPSGKPFTLQLGAFSQAANAQAMMASLAKSGLTAELVESTRGGKPIYQVRIGRFATAEEAAEYAHVNLKPRKFLSQPVPVGP